MIEFSGELSKENKNYILKINSLVGFLSFLIPVVLISVPIIICIFVWDWIFVLAMPILIAIPIVAAASPYIYKEKTLANMIPKKITINDKGMLKVELDKKTITKPVINIYKIIDKGDMYIIKLNFVKIDGFICQKNLIAKGSIKEFEKQFKNKIVRK